MQRVATLASGTGKNARRYSLGRERDVVNWFFSVGTRVFDRTTHQADICRPQNRLRRCRRVITKAMLQVRRDRQIRRFDYKSRVHQGFLARHLSVAPPKNACGGGT